MKLEFSVYADTHMMTVPVANCANKNEIKHLPPFDGVKAKEFLPVEL